MHEKTRKVNGRSVEIICSACGAETFVKRVPEYDGFVKVGERFICASCGHEFENEEDVPFKEKKTVDIFAPDDTLKKIDVFEENERERNCRHCKHYIVNPFTQRCGLHQKQVEATDICDDFEKKDEESPNLTQGVPPPRKDAL